MTADLSTNRRQGRGDSLLAGPAALVQRRGYAGPQGKLLQEDARRHHRSLLLQEWNRTEAPYPADRVWCGSGEHP